MAAAAPSPRRRASLVASPTPSSPVSSQIPRPQSAAGRYRDRSSLIPSNVHTNGTSAEVSGDHDLEKGQVRVVLRLRPSEPEDPNVPLRHRSVLVHPTSQTEVRVSVDPATLAGSATTASSSKRHPTFVFDRVLGEPASQVDLYNATARDRIEEFLKGFNVTFLAYGQTSSGKSYSMGTTGEDCDYLDISDADSRAGLIPRTVETIFRRAEEIRMASGLGASWECRVSFLELYNEDLIDLLANTNAPTNVSIRENHDGRIMWSGVREIKVQNVSEVMTLLHDGSLRRRTGETNMNATSSRSHAIFSLTLVQSRRADAADGDLRSATPSKRPMSVMGMGGPGSRSTTPQFSRPPPSSFSKLAGGRPSSMHIGNSQDDMVLITSKFNMVDLAGSERLKRTAAQGDRMKEGISINSGLLALGNVISALSEPAKNRGHVPYRDSKLTRLLQDSIGGNAMTTMIACISPLEYNISETINTINYASRARRIKNAVTKNQSEVGWDDIDYLRNQVTKLRAKIATVENEPRVLKKNDQPIDDGVLQRQVITLTDKLADLEDEFSHLQDQYFQKCREIVALSDPETLEDDKLRQFNETIEPVVLEYEKVVTSLNGQIAELRAEVALSQQASEEHSAELSKTQDRLTEHESYVQELQGRIAKLTQRNESSEAYIRDLEVKFRGFTDNDDRQGEVITTLNQEIQQLKTDSAKSNTYIVELEQRIATADARTVELTAAVERFELDAETREKQMQELEGRLAMFDDRQAAQQVTQLLEELEIRDRKIEDLENRIQLHSHETRDLPVEAKTQTPSTPPDTPPVLRTIVEDTDSEVDLLRKENLALMARLHEAESRYEELQATPEAIPVTPVLDPPSEQDEELEDERDLTQSPSKRGSTGESSESDTTLETPKLASRTVSPQIHDDPLYLAMSRSPYGTFRPSRVNTEPRLLRPLSLSQGMPSMSYQNGSPRYSWSAPSNGMLAFERSSPKFERSPKRASMPFDSKPLRSVQSLEIDISLLQKAVTDRDAQLKQREIEIKYLKKTLEQSNITAVSPQIGSEEVIERLRTEHADELHKIRDEHQRGMNALANEHHSSVGSLRAQLKDVSATHAMELEDLKESHRMDLEDLDSTHRKELESSNGELKNALDAAWEELSSASVRHENERNALLESHRSEKSELEQRHSGVLAALQVELGAATSQLEAVRAELAAAHEAKLQAEKELSSRPKDAIPLEEHNYVVSAMEEMEKALTSAEDEKRQLKMKADQVRFELSKIRDEFEVRSSADSTKISDLEQRCATLTNDNNELKQAVESRNRDSKNVGADRASRAKLPPIGPPPTAPLPPLPAGREAVMSPTPSQPRGEGSTESPRTSEAGSHDGHSPRPDSAGDAELRERLSTTEIKLAAKEKEHAQFEKDLMEYRKNNSKLKVRVDDANRELSDLKRERDALRRDVVEMKNELADAEYERIADRQRLEGARAEVAQYKAKLDRMVDAKVSKRSDQKLKCF